MRDYLGIGVKRIRVKKIQGDRDKPEYVWLREEDIVRVRKTSVPLGDRYELLVRDLDMGQNIVLTEATEEIASKLGLEGEFSSDPVDSKYHPDYVDNIKKKSVVESPLVAKEPIIPTCGSETAVSEKQLKALTVEPELEIGVLKKQLEEIERLNTHNCVTDCISSESISNSDYTNNKKELAENLLDG